MKDGFKSISIEPFNGYLDFQGPIDTQQSTGSLVLKGDIRLELIKAVNVKKATLKFIGSSRVCHQNTLDMVDVSTPILPKLKTHLFSSTTTLGPGEVILPWEMEILNIYPCSVMIKRVSISYKIVLTISLGLNRTVTAEYPIVIKRHLLPCLEVAPLVPTKLYTKTISTKFHYEIDAPRIVCVAQETIAMAIKLLTIGAQKRVLSIRTQVIQVELCRCNTLPKADADMTKFKSRQTTTGKKGDSNKYAKYSKRTMPAIIHTLDETQAMSSSRPLLLRHPIGEYLTLGMESPLAAVYHQLEITFQFGAKFEDIRAKVPIMIASAGPSQPAHSRSASNKQYLEPIPLALYPFEKIPVIQPLFVMDESRLDRNSTRNTDNTNNTPSLRIPTPSSGNSDVATMEDDDELSDFMEILPEYPQRNLDERSISGNMNESADISGELSASLPSQSLRRARSALDISNTAPTNDITNNYLEPKKTQLLQIPQQIRHQRDPAISAPANSKSLSSTPPTNHLSPGPPKQTVGGSQEIPFGMWPRPGTQVPHQWRRRSASQPFPTNDSPPSRPLKDSKRSMNLTIIPPSVITTGKSTLQHAATNNRSRTPVDPPSKYASDYHHPQRQQEVEIEDPIGASESSGSTKSSLLSSSYIADTSISGDSSGISPGSIYEPKSRPSSPTFAPAPGLPPSIPLRPQNANPVALLEESFVLSPGSLASTPVTSHHYDLAAEASSHHKATLHHTQGFIRSGGGRYPRSSDMLSVTSSVLDPDEDIMRMMQTMEIQYRRRMEQQQSLEHHYTYAQLPPLPARDRPTTVSYADDSSDDSDGEFVDTTGMYDDDTDTCLVYPSIAASPLPPPPNQDRADDDTVCLCPKHGVVVARR